MRILVILVLSLVAFWAVQDRMRLSQENSAMAARAAAGGRIPDDPRAVKVKQAYQQVLAMYETAMDGAAAAELPALESHAEPSAPLPTVERSAPRNWLQDRIANRKNPLGEVPRLSSPAYRRSPLANIPGAIFPSLRDRNDFWD